MMSCCLLIFKLYFKKSFSPCRQLRLPGIISQQRTFNLISVISLGVFLLSPQMSNPKRRTLIQIEQSIFISYLFYKRQTYPIWHYYDITVFELFATETQRIDKCPSMFCCFKKNQFVVKLVLNLQLIKPFKQTLVKRRQIT
jgi:hypothetical protein